MKKIPVAVRLILTVVLSLGIISSPMAAFVVSPTPAQAATGSVNDLQKQKEALEKQKAAKAAEEERQRQLVAKANQKLQEVAGDINDLRVNMSSTSSAIRATQDQIAVKDQEVAQLQSKLGEIDRQKAALVREMYIMAASTPPALMLFSNESVSKRAQYQAQTDAIQQMVTASYQKTVEAKVAVESARTELVKKNEELANLRAQQDEQQRGLASYQQTQAALKSNAVATIETLEKQQLDLAKKLGSIEGQISAALTAAIAARGGLPGGGPGSGNYVEVGTVIGIQGSTGNSTGDHVHFEIRANNTAVNPRPYVTNGTARWPLDSFRETQGFGYTSYALAGAYGGGPHTGIDIAGPKGSFVRAPFSGTVIMNQFYGGYGHVVAIINSQGLVAMMAHMR